MPLQKKVIGGKAFLDLAWQIERVQPFGLNHNSVREGKKRRGDESHRIQEPLKLGNKGKGGWTYEGFLGGEFTVPCNWR